MAATDDNGARGELGRLTRAVRERLEWQERGGVDALPKRARRSSPARPAEGDPRAAPARAATPSAARSDRSLSVGNAPASVPGAAAAPPSPTAIGAEGLRVLREHIGDCQRCKLGATRTHLVFGVGNPEAALVFVGEGPGADEDRLGEPFVGKAGQLLDKMIAAMGFSRDDVYICNVVKCRPPGNRTPEPDEVEQCEPFLVRQLAAIRPKVIVALGKSAAQALLKTDAPISRFRGQFTSYQGIPLMPTFHPAYLLRTPSAKRDVWEDLQKVMAELDRLGVPRRPADRSQP